MNLIIKTRDTRNIKHHKKVSIKGAYRSQIGEQLLHTAPSNWRRQEAENKMEFGDSEPPTLPSISVCRNIRQEAKKKYFVVPREKNPVSSLIKMKYSQRYAGSIHTVSV